MSLWSSLKAKIFKFDLSKTEDKLKFFILASGLLIFIGLFTVTAIQLTMYPSFCKMCHEMQPEYVTWEMSSHNQIKCTDCHIEPGVTNLIKHKILAMGQLYQHVTGQVPNPIEMPHEIKNDVCEKCHSMNRSASPSGDLKIPHDRHAKKDVACVSCHSGVVHGLIAEREATVTLSNYSQWTDEVGKEQLAGKNSRPQMNTCIKCHRQRGVSTKCEICHKSIQIPSNHKEEAWKLGHGKIAFKEGVEYCNKCHSYSMGEMKASAGDEVVRYARGNDFCSACHMARPVTHDITWKMTHKKEAVNDKKGCLVCHDRDKPQKDDGATKTHCDTCHGPQGNPTHPNNWRPTHRFVVKERGIMGGRCYSCHDRTHCSKCHTGR